MMIYTNVLGTNVLVDVHWFMFRPNDEESLIDMTIWNSGELSDDVIEGSIISVIEQDHIERLN